MPQYYVEVEDRVWRYLARLPSDIRHQFARRMSELKLGVFGHKRLSDAFPYELWEFKLAGYRTYYVTYKGVISVSQIVYDGSTYVYAVGTKNSQRYDVREGLSYIRKKQNN